MNYQNLETVEILSSKFIVFEKITPDYYVLSLLDNSELDNIKSLSRVWGKNGSGAASKAYGML